MAEEASVMQDSALPGGDADISTSDRSQSKKRRIAGACDLCKRKKIRCNSSKMPDNRCTNCLQYGAECTHKEVAKTLGSAKSYVESLEARLEKIDRLLNKLVPGINVNQELDRLAAEDDEEPQTLSRNDDDDLERMLALDISELKLNPTLNRFFGQSSSIHLVLTALDMKQEYTGEEIEPLKYGYSKRDEFWAIPPWLSNDPEHPEVPTYTYPPEDLMPFLIDAYFKEINYFLPLLHRPTFERSIREKLHVSDHMFGATLLLVCALGGRYSNDPRVLADGSDEPRSAGWRWYEQVSAMRSSLFKKATLYELQMLALHVIFSNSSETPQGVWSELGFALRLVQEVGAHRKKNKWATPTAEDEIWKRVFWVILSLDRQISSEAGRACGLQEEDFDLEIPLECDDEFWETGFHQPPGKPSYIAFFITYLRLTDILASAMRLIYSIKRPKSAPDNIPLRSQQQSIAELDSAMNKWMDSVPTHLKWNPACGNPLFLKQSAALHATYYYVQMLIHRPFIPSPRNPLQNAFPSLAICTNAARSCCHVLEAFMRLSVLPLAQLQKTIFNAAVILLLNIWSGKRSGCAPNPKRDMEDVQRCMLILATCEKRWALAGRLRDILVELAYAGEVSVSNRWDQYRPSPPRNKRPRDAEVWQGAIPTASSSSSSASPSSSSQSEEVREMAGTRRASRLSSAPLHDSQAAPVPPYFALPVYSNELARLPIYGQFNFMDSIGSDFSDPSTAPSAAGSCPPTSRKGDGVAPITFDPFVFSTTGASNSAGFGPSNSSMDACILNGLLCQQATEDMRFANPAQQGGYTTNYTTNRIDSQPMPSVDLESLLTGPEAGGASFGACVPADLSFGAMPPFDDDIMTMWSTAPTSLDLDDWNSYISSVIQMTQATSHSYANS